MIRRVLLYLGAWLSPRLERWRLELIYEMHGIEGVAHTLRYLRDPLPVLRAHGAQVGGKTMIYPGVIIHAAQEDFSNLRVGSSARILRDCMLDLTDTITIADQAVLSLGCKLVTHLNVARSPLAQVGYEPAQAPIAIERGAVLFSNVTVLMGVTVGECAMVAAGAVVLSDVAPHTLVGGVPARKLKNLGAAVDWSAVGLRPE